MARGAGEPRPGTKLWLCQAERDRMHPAAMGWIYADPCRIGPVPGSWDAVSDLVPTRIGPVGHHHLLGGRAACKAFEAFARRVAALPDPGAVLGYAGGTPPRIAIDEPGLAFAHVVGLVRHACDRPQGRAEAADRLFAYAADHLSPGLVRWTMDLVQGPHGLKSDAGMPGLARCLELLNPDRVAEPADVPASRR